MTTDLSKTLNLIRKLLLKADSARALGSIEEAAAFAAKANELLLRHKLEMSDVEVAEEIAADPVGDEYVNLAALGHLKNVYGNRRPWLEQLATDVARAHFCRILVIPGSKTIHLIGRHTDRLIAKYLLETLISNGERLAARYERTSRNAAIATGDPFPLKPKASWLLGYVRAIGQRLVAMRHAVEQQGGQFALTRFAAAEQITKQLWEANKTGEAGGFRDLRGDTRAYDEGHRAGSRVTLNGGLGGGVDDRGTLRSGQHLLGGGR